MFTDGAALANGYANCTAGWAVYFGEHDPRNLSAKITTGPVSNQVAELIAVERALDLHERLTKHEKWVIVTDSRYTIQCLTKWFTSWEKNDWKTSKGEPVKHQKVIQSCIQKLKRKNVSFLHVNSHQREPRNKKTLEWFLWSGNAGADHLARSTLWVKNVVVPGMALKMDTL